MKTLNLINSYLTKLNEQAEGDPTQNADATDIAEQPEPETPEPLTSEGEKYLIDLLVKAFLHVPDESEGKIVKELQATMLKANPKDVAEAIENMLEISPEDTKNTLNLTTGIN